MTRGAAAGAGAGAGTSSTEGEGPDACGAACSEDGARAGAKASGLHIGRSTFDWQAVAGVTRSHLDLKHPTAPLEGRSAMLTP